ncbi:MAG: hypothetical protein AB8G14_13165 [Ilumatobacter sp.]
MSAVAVVLSASPTVQAAGVIVSENRWTPQPVDARSCDVGDPLIGQTTLSTTSLDDNTVVRVEYTVLGPPADVEFDADFGTYEFGGTSAIDIAWFDSFNAEIVGAGTSLDDAEIRTTAQTLRRNGRQFLAPRRYPFNDPQYGTNRFFSPGDSAWVDYRLRNGANDGVWPVTRVNASWLSQQFTLRTSEPCFLDYSEEPTISGSITLTHDDPSNTSGRFALGESFDVSLALEAPDASAATIDIAAIAQLFEAADELTILAAPDPVHPASVTLPAGGRVEYEWRVRADSPGGFRLAGVFPGVDASGNDLQPAVLEASGSISPFEITIVQEPKPIVLTDDNDGDGDVDADDLKMDLTVRIKNVSDETITDIEKAPMTITSNVAESPEVPLRLERSPIGEFADLAPGESTELTWGYIADDAFDARASFLAVGAIGLETVTGLGREDVGVLEDIYLEAFIKPPDQTLRSGIPIRISGRFANVSDSTDDPQPVAFGVVPITSGNAGNGFFGPVGGATATTIELTLLEPGASIDLSALLYSVEAARPSDASVTYEVGLFLVNDASGEWERVSDLFVDISEDDGNSAQHDFALQAVTAVEEPTNYVNCAEDLAVPFYVSCRLARGVETFAYGGAGLARLVGTGLYTIVEASVSYLQWYVWGLRTYIEAVLGDPAAQQALIQEIYVQLLTARTLGLQAAQIPQLTLDAVGDAMSVFFKEFLEVATGGDLVEILGYIAEKTGENLDLAFEALVAARAFGKAVSLARADRAGVSRDAVEAAMLRRNARVIDQATTLARTNPAALPGSRLLPAGIDVTDLSDIWRAWGLSRDNLDNILRIAQDEGVTLAFRSRAPGAAKKIADGVALPKPLGIKIKGVNDLDVDFLGYPDEWKELVVLADPPITPHPKGRARDVAIEEFLDADPRLNVDTPAGRDLRARVDERIRTRLDEFNELPELVPAWEEFGIKVDFDPEFNQLKRVFLEPEVPNRAADLDEFRAIGDGRNAVLMKMEKPDGSGFLPVTGDIDFLGLLLPDGRMLGDTLNPVRYVLEEVKRARIYNKLRATVGMQHGESFSLLLDKLRTKYLSDGLNSPTGETLLAATQNGRLVTTYFDDGLSLLQGGLNSSLTRAGDARAFFGGVFSEISSPNRGLNAWTLERLVEQHSRLRDIQQLFTLSMVGRAVNGADDDDVESLFERLDRVMRPDGRGGLKVYEPPSLEAPGQARFDASRAGQANATSSAGRWIPVDVADLLADGPIAFSPFSYFAEDELVGDDGSSALTLAELAISEASPFFVPGDRVVVDPGGVDEEFVTVASIDPLRFVDPLTNDHEIGTFLAVIDAVSKPAAEVAALAPIVPVRLLDTRSSGETVDGRFQAIGSVDAGSVVEVQVAGRGGVAPDAQAVAMNLTAIRSDRRGFLTLFPCDQQQPTTSSLNYLPGRVVANSAVAKLSADGTLCVFSVGDVDVLFDVNAYFEADVSSFDSVTPARLLETRSVGDTVDGDGRDLGRLEAGSVTSVQVSGRGGVAGDAAAVAVNVTAIQPEQRGYVTLFPCGVAQPETSSLNYVEGSVVANSAVVALSATGTLCIFTLRDVDLVLDVNAWMADDAGFDALTPARLLETRGGAEPTVDGVSHGAGLLEPGSTTRVQVAGRGGVSDDATAVALNVTAIRPTRQGFATLYPCDADLPLTSSVNFSAGQVVANSAVVKLDADGGVCLYVLRELDVALDVNAAWVG